MSQRNHANARISRAVREAIRQSPDSLRTLAARYGINLKTAAKWKRRADAEDLPSGPKQAPRSPLTAEEEEIIVGFRRKTLLPLDDCLYSLQARIPHLSRSTLHRCLRRHGLNRLPESARPRRARQKDGAAHPGCLDIDVTTTLTADGPVDVFVAMDRASKFVFLDLAARADEVAARSFLAKVTSEAPFAVSLVHVPRTFPFVRSEGGSPIAALCTELGIALREAPSIGPAPLSRLVGLASTGNAVAAEGGAAFATRLHDFVHAYNFHRRLKALRGLTPFEFICSVAPEACTTR